MRCYTLKMLAATLAVQRIAGFLGSNRMHRSHSVALHAALLSQKLASTIGVDLFEDENALRSAYDEWRAEYGKGEFDRARFETFKSNFRTLTIANISARDKALQEGSQPPQWMYLNRFGDFSDSEFRASQSQIDDDDIYKIYENWCDQFGAQPDALRYEIFASNYIEMKKYTARTGKHLKMNEYADRTREEALANKSGIGNSSPPPPPPPRKTLIVPQLSSESKPKGDARPNGANLDDVRGTRVLQKANGESYSSRTMPVRGTQVLQKANLTQPAESRGTRPIQGTRRILSSVDYQQQMPLEGTRPVQGTRRIVPAENQVQGTKPVQGTRRIMSAADTYSQQSSGPNTRQVRATTSIPSGENTQNQPFYGTQQIQGTRSAMPVDNQQQPMYGTRPVRGTRKVESADAYQQQYSSGTQPVRGTRVVASFNSENGEANGLRGGRGTRVVRKVDDTRSNPEGTQVVEGSGQRAGRGTISLGQLPNGGST
eukprot:scaffold42_cov133-Cylindrotheca_fusiformis.AAC.7